MSFIEKISKDLHIEKKIFEEIFKNKKKVALFGASGAGFYTNMWLKQNGIEPIFFVDDDIKKQQKGFQSIPVIGFEEFQKNISDTLLLLSIANNALSVLDNLHFRGVEDCFFIGSRDPWSEVTTYEYVLQNIDKFEETYNSFADEFSKKVFINILNNKLTGNAKLATEVKTKDLYFEKELIKFSDEECFLDIGACDGESTLSFVEHCDTEYKKIYLFEPDATNIEKIKFNLKSKNICDYELINKCVWSHADVLQFSFGQEHTGSVLDNGENILNQILIEADSIDNIFLNKEVKITFIKMDIEGAEKQALLGAKNIIQKYKPKLAISVYHKREDYFEILLLIKSYNPQYKFYLRNYTDTAADTVLYCI